MKTLKKTLCLVLALIMVVGTLAVAASADVAKTVDNFANYKDGAAAKASAYAEAIDVNLGLGIINGVSKTELKLGDTLTRAQAAKIACYLLLGEDVAEALAPSSSFDDVKESSWAAKYIAYASDDEVGILNGVGSGKFNPSGELTGYQFVKILLNSLGFGLETKTRINMQTGDIENYVVNSYTGNNWKTKVSVDAKKHGLTLKGVDMNKALTREQAMQLVFEALITSMFDGDAADLAYDFGANTVGTDNYGRNVIVFVDADGPISGSYSATPFHTVKLVEGTTLAKILEDYNKENKLEGSNAYTTTLSESYTAGMVVELYATEKVVTKVVYYDYDLDKITAVATDGTVTSADGKFNGKKIEGAKKDEIYLIPYSYNLAEYVLADAKKVTEPDVTGKVTTYEKNGKYLTVAGTKYYPDESYNGKIGVNSLATMFAAKDFANDYGFYTSPAGTVLAITKLTDGATTPDFLYGFAVAYQVQKGSAAGADSTDLIGNVTKGSEAVAAAVVVQVITPAGENKVVTLKLDSKGEKVTDKSFFTGKAQTDSGVDPATGEIKDNSNGKKSVVLSAPEFIKYYMDGDKAVIVSDEALDAGKDYTKASVQYDSKNLTSSTVLYVVTEKTKDGKITGYTAETKTGYKNFPAFEAAKTSQKYLTDDAGRITALYIWGSSSVDVKTVHVPAYVEAVGDLSAKGFEITVWVGGEKKTMYAESATTVTAGKFYKDLTEEDGVVKTATEWTGTTRLDVAEVTFADAAYFTYAGGTFEYPANVTIVDLTGKGLTAVAAKQKLVVIGTTGDDAVASNATIVIYITGVVE